MPAIFSFPMSRGASDTAVMVERVFWGMTLFSGVIILTVGVLVLYFCVRYRAGSRRPRSPISENVERMEIAWIIILSVLALGMFGWAGKVYYDLASPPADARTIYIVGKQWMWQAEHPGGRREINELHLPAGEPVRLVITSQDVIHSFFVPSFREKMDAVPGRYTTMWFTARDQGEYHLFCAEYCGADHSRMVGRVVVMEPTEYQHWLGPAPGDQGPIPGTPGTARGGLAVGGRGAFFQLGCNACHVPAASVRAPRLDGIFGQQVRLDNGQLLIADEQYIRESILNPNAKLSAGYPPPSLMPTYQGRITEEQLREIVEFIRSLRHGWPPEYSAPAGAQPGSTPAVPAPGGTP